MKRFFSVMLLLASAFLFADEQEVFEFKGSHFLASYMGCDMAALTDIAALTNAMEEAAKASGATILKTSSHVFPPNGLTMVILLSESHASIHTYPEFNACFVDLFTCGTRCSAEKFHEVLLTYLKPSQVCEKMLLRDHQITGN
jgi:S-adenosylmethionine decarboxylase